jgi:hypothetical protein
MGKRTTLLTLALLTIALQIGAQETASFGRNEGWSELMHAERLVSVGGREGYQDIELEAFRHRPNEQTELLLHFDSAPVTDAAGNFTVVAPNAELAAAVAQTGRQALLIDSAEDQIVLHPGAGSFFRPGMEWGSFTIEFWLYPVQLPAGEPVFLWQAQEGPRNQFQQQRVAVVTDGGSLRAEFVNFFIRPNGSGVSVSLSGTRPLIPRRWSHHAFRFQEESGLLEYLVDGTPVDITHVSQSGRQDGSVFFPRIAELSAEGLLIGGGIVGAMDEVRIVRDYVEDVGQPKYPRNGGILITDYIDMGSSGAQPLQLNAEYRAPGLSDVFFYYRVSDFQTAGSPDGSSEEAWIPVVPGEELTAEEGRFVQLRVELFPDTKDNVSPSLSSMELVYRPDPAPLPPTALRATPMDGAVLLEWAPVRDRDVTGYRVYYGTEPGMYFGTESSSGESPIDVGRVASFIVEGLNNGQLYFFAVSARDATEHTVPAELSTEAAARPARVYR